MPSPAPTDDHQTSEITVIESPIPPTMRAVRQRRYGTSEVLENVEIDTPTPAADTVLVEVKAASLNPLDYHMMTGTPWLVRMQNGFRRPKRTGMGVDVAGRIVAIGDDVTGFAIGDEVVGVAVGSCAEYVVATPERIVAKPAGVTFHDAAGMGVAAITALQGLRDKGELEPGQHVLVNGASGGVGLAAVQLAKWMGAEVTGVCSTRNVELVASMGADHVVDYTTDDFTDTDVRYDLFFDNQGNRPLAASRRILTENGIYLLIGGPKKNRALGPVVRMIRALVRFRFTSQTARALLADEKGPDLQILADLMATGDLKTVIDRTYDLDDIREAMDHLAAGHARGKVIITP
ncbi:MAG: NAD(P)-dependent alcohol dehydrogenase [Actinomycetota bacterium]